MKYSVKHIFTLLFCALALTVSADNITVDKAEAVANKFFNARGYTTRSSSLRLIWDGETSVTRSASAPAFYVFGNRGGKGFVIVAADDVATPILGYSFNNDFVVKDMPEHVRAFFEAYRSDINYARAHGIKASASTREAWRHIGMQTRAIGNNVLGSALWNQREPYNRQTPLKGGSAHCLTGCVATATSIVMFAHKHPAKGDGATLGAYTAPTEKVYCPAVTLNKAYDWNNMLADYNNGYNDTQAAAVAMLMHHVGHGIDMDYGLSVSNSTLRKAASFLRNHMDYSPRIVVKQSSDFAPGAWADALRNELDKGYPLIFSGTGNGTGHAYVIDGYKADGTFGVNLGWGGMYNGYYSLNAIPQYGGNPQTAIFNMQAKKPGEKNPDILKFVPSGVDPSGIITGVDASQIKKDVPFTVSLKKLQNPDNGSFLCTVILALVDNYDNIIQVLAEKKDFNADGSYFELTCDFGSVTITEPIKRDYRLRAYYIPNGTTDRAMVEGSVQTKWEVLLTPTPGYDIPDPIEQQTSLSYSADTKVVTLTVPADLTAVGFCQTSTNKDFSSVVKRDGSTVTINTASLAADSYTITLTRGKEKYSMELTL